jgi:hypothetical protein
VGITEFDDPASLEAELLRHHEAAARAVDLEKQRDALIDVYDATDIGRVMGRLVAHDWDVEPEPWQCVDRMAAEIERLRRRLVQHEGGKRDDG